jgi:PAS domain S-box-containing protein
VVSDDNYPPYVMREDGGAIRGILVDQWKLWEQKTGIAVRLVAMDWGEAQRYMAEGKADVIDTMFITEERAKLYDFSRPWAKIEVPVFFNRNISGINDAQSLHGFTVGVKEGDAAIDFLKANGIETLELFPSYEAIVRAAADQKIRVFCVDSPPARYFLYKFGLEQEFRSTAPLYTGEFHRAVRKGNTVLLQTIEEGFAKISAGEYASIERKWMGTPVLLPPEVFRPILYSAIGVGLLALALFLWIYTLRRQVALRTAQLHGTLEAKQTIFQHSAVSLWEEDISALRAELVALRASGVLDIRRYLEEHPEFLRKAARLITVIDVNEATLALYEVADRRQLLGPLDRTLDLNDSVTLASLRDDVLLIAEGGTRLARESKATTPSGKKLDIVIVVSVPNPNDAYPHMLVNVLDITRRKHAEEELRKSERHYREMFVAAQRHAKDLELVNEVRTALLRELDLPELIRTVVEGIAATFGYTQVSLYLLKEETLELQHQMGYEVTVEKIPISQGVSGRVARTGLPVLLEDVRMDPDYIETTKDVCSELCIPLFDQGRVVGTLSVENKEGMKLGETDLQLMTALGEHVSIAIARARLYAEVRRNEERYRSFMQNLPVGVLTVDTMETIIFANPASTTLFAPGQVSIEGMNLRDFMSDEEFKKIVGETARRSRGETSTYEVEIKRLDGAARHVQVTATPQQGLRGEFIGALATFQDITDQALLKKQVEEERAQLLTLINNLPDAVYMKDRDGRFVIANRVVAEIMAAGEPQNLIGKTDFDFYSREKAEEFRAGERAVMEEGRSINDKLEPRFVSGEVRWWILTTKVPLIDQNGNVRGLVGVGHDITARKDAEEALIATERRYQSIVENISDALIIHDFNGTIIDVNETACRMLGYLREELIGTGLARIQGEESGKSFKGNIERVKAAGALIFEAVDVRKDGSLIPVEVNAKVVSREGHGIIQLFSRDLSERKKAQEEQRRLQEQFHEAQKMEAVGRLAGGIAHDFNNLLTVINGYCEMGLDRARVEDPLRGDLEEIKRTSLRAAMLTSQLLAFSRRQILQPRVLSLGKLVEGMAEMLKRLLGEDIEIHTHASADLWNVRADFGKIEQVVMNLSVNSRDAMPHGGMLTIETSNVVLEKEYTRQHFGAKSGEYVLLAVSDTGVGMDTATQKRIFEPFFTTKEMGKGTGLGLATVYGIVKQSEGFIDCYSEVGKGTIFKIYLPRVVAENEPPTQAEHKPTNNVRGSEVILLVEDDEAVRRIAVSILEGGGYVVVSAGNGAEALRRLSELERRPDLLVTDVVMPGMDGRNVARNFNARYPSVPVLFISGYTENSIVHDGVLDEGVEFIPKPFTRGELLQRVREVLDRGGP